MAGTIKFRKGNTTYSLVGNIYAKYLYPTFNDTVAILRVYYFLSQGEGDYSHSNAYGSTSQGTKVLVGTSSSFGRIYIDNSSPTVHFRKNGKTYHCAKSWWTVSKDYIYYNSNGGSGSMDSQSFWSEDGEKVTIKANTFTRTGHTFSKWNTRSDGTGTSYSPGTSVGTSLSLYAIWAINTYSIVYKANGGTGSDVTQSFNYGTSVTTKGVLFTRANYNQTKWNTAANGGGTSYSLSTNIGAINKSLTLYAYWTSITYANWTYSLSSTGVTSGVEGKTAYYCYDYDYVFTVQVKNGNGHNYVFTKEDETVGLFSSTMKTTTTFRVSTNDTTTLTCTVNIQSSEWSGSGDAKFYVRLYDITTGSSVLASSLSFSQNLVAGDSVTEE